jgi:hypothetical protein
MQNKLAFISVVLRKCKQYIEPLNAHGNTPRTNMKAVNVMILVLAVAILGPFGPGLYMVELNIEGLRQ